VARQSVRSAPQRLAAARSSPQQPAAARRPLSLLPPEWHLVSAQHLTQEPWRNQEVDVPELLFKLSSRLVTGTLNPSRTSLNSSSYRALTTGIMKHIIGIGG